jgi:hypothetical protein
MITARQQLDHLDAIALKSCRFDRKEVGSSAHEHTRGIRKRSTLHTNTQCIIIFYLFIHSLYSLMDAFVRFKPFQYGQQHFHGWTDLSQKPPFLAGKLYSWQTLPQWNGVQYRGSYGKQNGGRNPGGTTPAKKDARSLYSWSLKLNLYIIIISGKKQERFLWYVKIYSIL